MQGQPRRMFGQFYCENCQHRWSSGNAWPGKGQKCKTCLRMVLPKSLQPLKPQPHNKDCKPHKRGFCQMCQDLGYDCRDYIPPPSRHPSTITNTANNKRKHRSTNTTTYGRKHHSTNTTTYGRKHRSTNASRKHHSTTHATDTSSSRKDCSTNAATSASTDWSSCTIL